MNDDDRLTQSARHTPGGLNSDEHTHQIQLMHSSSQIGAPLAERTTSPTGRLHRSEPELSLDQIKDWRRRHKYDSAFARIDFSEVERKIEERLANECE